MKQILLAAGAAALMAWATPSVAASQARDNTVAQTSVAGVQLAQRDREDRRDRANDRRRDRDRSNNRNRARNDRRNPNAYRERYPRAHVGRPHWSRGDRLYRDYRGSRYYVNDWQRYNLRRPPRGYRWVRVDNDYILVAITTGIIMDIIMMNQMNRQHR